MTYTQVKFRACEGSPRRFLSILVEGTLRHSDIEPFTTNGEFLPADVGLNAPSDGLYETAPYGYEDATPGRDVPAKAADISKEALLKRFHQLAGRLPETEPENLLKLSDVLSRTAIVGEAVVRIDGRACEVATRYHDGISDAITWQTFCGEAVYLLPDTPGATSPRYSEDRLPGVSKFPTCMRCVAREAPPAEDMEMAINDRD